MTIGDIINFIKERKRASVIFLLALIAIPLSLYLYSRNQNSQSVLGNESTQTSETKTIIDEVGKLVELPTDESPTVASITDVNKLSGQPFFAKAQNGDKVLIYSKSGKAIIYRPGTNKIIEIAPIVTAPNISPTQAEISIPTSSPTPTSPPFKLKLPSFAPTVQPTGE